VIPNLDPCSHIHVRYESYSSQRSHSHTHILCSSNIKTKSTCLHPVQSLYNFSVRVGSLRFNSKIYNIGATYSHIFIVNKKTLIVVNEVCSRLLRCIENQFYFSKICLSLLTLCIFYDINLTGAWHNARWAWDTPGFFGWWEKNICVSNLQRELFRTSVKTHTCNSSFVQTKKYKK